MRQTKGSKQARKSSGVAESITRGLQESIAWAKGETVEVKQHTIHIPDVDIRQVRTGLNLSQEAFAEKYGFPLSTLRNWEQRRREPEISARILIALIEKHPQIVEEVLSA